MDVGFFVRRDTDLEDVRDEREVHASGYDVCGDEDPILGISEIVGDLCTLRLADAGVQDAGRWHARQCLEDISVKVDERGSWGEDDGFEGLWSTDLFFGADAAYQGCCNI